MSKVLVVGGAGYIGGHLTDRLIESKHEVRVYDNLLFEERYLKEVDFIFGDVRDTKKLKPLLLWADCVIWLVGLVGDGACSLNPDLTKEININSVKWLRNNFDRRIIFMSTCSIYGAQEEILYEDSKPKPLSLYARSKVEGEKLLGDEAIYFRLGTLFGLGDLFSRIRLDLVLNLLTTKACIYKKISVFGGNQWRPHLHVRDVAGAILTNIETNHVGPYNLCTKNMIISDLGNEIIKIVKTAKLEISDIKFEDARNYKVSAEKAKSDFKFSPQLSIQDGVREIQKLIENGRIRDISESRYSNTDYLRPKLTSNTSPIGGEILTTDYYS